jgi:hypothetical protein
MTSEQIELLTDGLKLINRNGELDGDCTQVGIEVECLIYSLTHPSGTVRLRAAKQIKQEHERALDSDLLFATRAAIEAKQENLLESYSEHLANSEEDQAFDAARQVGVLDGILG